MTGLTLARQRPNGRLLIAAALLLSIGLLMGFGLAQVVSPAGVTTTDVHNAPAGVFTPGQFGGLSPDARDELNRSPQFGGLSPDAREERSQTQPQFGGLSPDERDQRSTAP